MKIILTGTGTSSGIPAIACSCPRCTSNDKHDKRLRTSAYITGSDDTAIVIDTGPEFRIQALTYKINKLDAVLLTHAHADHVHGLDDIRVFSNSYRNVQNTGFIKNNANTRPALKVYSNHQTIEDVYTRFNYIFSATQQGGGKPRIELVDLGTYKELTTKIADKKTFTIGCLQITPVPMMHGTLPVCGWKIYDSISHTIFAYLTDCNFIPNSSIKLVKGANCVIIDGLREKIHPTHCSFEDAYTYAQKIEAQQTWITHISHSHTHKEIIKWFKHREIKDKKNNHITKPFHCAPAYDGLVIKL
jgi:phosphoribosyl 1,2-cyclic phosphate phosphodiesterase